MQIKRTSIIGASGGMGSFFKKKFTQTGYSVFCLDKPLLKSDLNTIMPQTDLLLLAVPIRSLAKVLESIQGLLPKQSILMDICSIKSSPMKLMLNYHPGPVAGTHPLFGPEPEPEEQHRIAVIPGRDKIALKQILSLLSSMNLSPFTCSAKHHDQAMSYIQGLNYVTSLSYLAAASGIYEIEKFLTPSFKRRLHSAQKMLTSDLELFQNIFEDNPFSHEAVRQFRSYLNLAAAGELDLLSEKAEWWWTNSRNTGGVP